MPCRTAAHDVRPPAGSRDSRNGDRPQCGDRAGGEPVDGAGHRRVGGDGAVEAGFGARHRDVGQTVPAHRECHREVSSRSCTAFGSRHGASATDRASSIPTVTRSRSAGPYRRRWTSCNPGGSSAIDLDEAAVRVWRRGGGESATATPMTPRIPKNAEGCPTQLFGCGQRPNRNNDGIISLAPLARQQVDRAAGAGGGHTADTNLFTTPRKIGSAAVIFQAPAGVARAIPVTRHGLTPRRRASRQVPSAGVAEERSAPPEVGMPPRPMTLRFMSFEEVGCQTGRASQTRS